MVGFKDITAQSDSLLLKGFVHEKQWALELKHRLDNPVFTESASLGTNGKVMCGTSTHMVLPQGATVNGTLNIDGTAVISAIYPPQFLPGLTLSALLNRKLAMKSTTQALDITADLKHKYLQTKGTISPFTRNWTLSTCASFKQDLRSSPVLNGGDIITVGYEVTGNTELSSLRCSVAGSLARPVKDHNIVGALKLSPHGKSAFGKVSLSVAGKSPKPVGSEMAAEWVYILPEDRSELTIGAAWFLDPKTRQTALKARLDHEGRVAAAINHKVSETVSLTLGAQFDATKKLVGGAETADATKFGLKLNLLA